MMNTLINCLDSHLRDCRMYADSTSLRRTYFDQAFGMLTMYNALYPNDFAKTEKLWNEVYRPQFEEIIYGV